MPTPGAVRSAPKVAPNSKPTSNKTKPTGLIITREQLDAAEAADSETRLESLGREMRDRSLRSLLEGVEFEPHDNVSQLTDLQLADSLAKAWKTGRVTDVDQPPALGTVSFLKRGSGEPMVYFGKRYASGDPGLQGADLIRAVRRVVGHASEMPDDSEAVTPGLKAVTPRSSPLMADRPINGAVGKLKTNGKSLAKSASGSSASSPADLMKGIEVLREEDIPFNLITRSKHNPRTVFDEELIAKMAPTVETICKLTPLTIREVTGELIDGETRHRAAEVAGAKSLRCKVIRCSDAQAACIRLLTSIQRRDLNAIDRARGLKALQEEHGMSQRDMQDLVKLQQGSISNLIRLLDLPQIWIDRLMSGEITATAARPLCAWIGEDAVFKALEQYLQWDKKETRFVSIEGRLNQAVMECSRPLDGYHYDGYHYDSELKRSREVKLKPTDEQRTALRVRKVDTKERAFNIKLWNELADAFEKAEAARQAKRQAKASSGKNSTNGASSGASSVELKRKQTEQLNKRLYRFKIQWLQAMLVDRVSNGTGASDKDDLVAIALWLTTREGHYHRETTLDKLVLKKTKQSSTLLIQLLGRDHKDNILTLSDLICEQLAGRFDGYHNVFNPVDYEDLAAWFKIDLAKDWANSMQDGACCGHLWDAFTAIWSKDQMIELLNEWRIKPVERGFDQMKRSELAELLSPEKPCPKAILNVKAVSLT